MKRTLILTIGSLMTGALARGATAAEAATASVANAAGTVVNLGTLATTGTAGTIAAGSGPSVGGSMLQTIVALAIVLGVLGVLAWVFRRLARPAAGHSPLLRVVASQSLGARERVVIVESNGQWLVLGVTSQNISLLATMTPPADAAPGAATTLPAGIAGMDFSRLLAQVLRKDKS